MLSQDQHSCDDTHTHPGHGLGDARKRTAFAAILTFGFMIVEVIGGVISGSLALLADAAHMLTDAGALGLAWLGFALAEKPADDRRSFGWARFKILAAFVNGLALIGLSIWIVVEALQRLQSPHPIQGELLLGIAVIGLVFNLVAFKILHGGHNHDDLNLQGAIWHVLGDLLGSVAAIIGAIVILTTGWLPVDPLLSLIVAVIIAIGGTRLVVKTGRILIESVPQGLSIQDIHTDLSDTIKDAERISHIHAWALNETQSLLTLDIVAKPGADKEALRLAVKNRLAERFRISHSTVEIQDPSDSPNTKGPCLE